MRAKVREHRPAQWQARQAKAKGKRENRYVIKVMGLNVKQGRGEVPLVRENQRLHRAFSLAVK